MSNDAKTKEKVRIAVFFSLCILLVVGIFLSIGSGTVSLSVSETWAALLGEADADTDRIVNLIRLPRTIVTVLVGANLALAGCNLQGVLHNPLADPGIIGVSAGAGLFAMVKCCFSQNNLPWCRWQPSSAPCFPQASSFSWRGKRASTPCA